jgi:exopolyphosphatase / guanosine-5'-triphosphate,3'-diphosphate pyrophosphatase
MSVAAVDVGSNSVRLLVLADDGTRVLRRITTTRLAEGVDRTGQLADAAIAAHRRRARRVPRRVGAARRRRPTRRTCASPRRRPCGTRRPGPVPRRGPRAGRDPVDVISGEEEAALGFAGATGAVPTQDPCLVIDVGGGSTELVVGRDGDVLASVSTQLGCVRLTERDLHHDPPSGRACDAATRTADAVLTRRHRRARRGARDRTGSHSRTSGRSSPSPAPRRRSRRCTSGSTTTRSPASTARCSSASVLDALAAPARRMTVEERAALGPVQPGRAEVLHGGAIVLARAPAARTSGARRQRGRLARCARRGLLDRSERCELRRAQGSGTGSAGARDGPRGVAHPAARVRGSVRCSCCSRTGPMGPRLVLTRRRPDLRSHPGQLSFPGGRVEPGEDAVEAALREAVEEIGLDPASVDGARERSDLLRPAVTVLGRPGRRPLGRPHALVPEPREVAEVLHVDLASLTDERRWRHTPIGPRGGRPGRGGSTMTCCGVRPRSSSGCCSTRRARTGRAAAVRLARSGARGEPVARRAARAAPPGSGPPPRARRPGARAGRGPACRGPARSVRGACMAGRARRRTRGARRAGRTCAR